MKQATGNLNLAVGKVIFLQYNKRKLILFVNLQD